MKSFKEIFTLLSRLRKSHDILDNKALYAKLTLQSKCNPLEIVFIKKLLQDEHPKVVRSEICSQLFKEYITKNEKVFFRNLFMTID